MPSINTSFTVAPGEIFSGGGDEPVFRVTIPAPFVPADTGNFSFLNLGQISAVGPAYAAGIWFTFESHRFGTLDNRGLISANATTLAYGIDIPSHGPHLIFNSGTIEVTSGNSAFGIRSYTGLLFHNQEDGVVRVVASNEMVGLARGIYLANSGDVINDGLIHVSGGATLYGIQAIGFQHSGRSIINPGGGGGSTNYGIITNNGSIIVEDSDTPESRSYGIAVTGLALPYALPTPNIINNGTITADVAIWAYYGGWSPFPHPQEWVVNTGTINGEIRLGAGDDVLENHGVIVGDVFLETGNNTYDGRDGSLDGDITASYGDDTIWSGTDDDNIDAGAGNDWVDAGAGDDIIAANVGNNTINGGAGVDTGIFTSSSTDTVWTRNPDGSWTIDRSVNGVDTVTNLEYLQFTDRTVFLDRPQSNFSTDGVSDFFLRNTSTGAMVMWFNGTGSGAASLGSLAAAWVTEGFGDFDGDGRDDILWRDSTNGNMSMWFMDNQTVSGSGGFGVGLDWRVSGIGDINGDGRDDIIWRNNNGDLILWFMNGGSFTGASLGNVSTAWQIEVVGDFNGDGRDDFIWRNGTTGDMSMWLMNGTAVTPNNFANVGDNWNIVGVGDLSGDGRDDVIWRDQTTGNTSLWFMNGGTIVSQSGFNVATNYSIADIGDYNGDGRDDIVWRNANTNDVLAWFMNGASVQGSAFLGGLGSDWIINPGG